MIDQQVYVSIKQQYRLSIGIRKPICACSLRDVTHVLFLIILHISNRVILCVSYTAATGPPKVLTWDEFVSLKQGADLRSQQSPTLLSDDQVCMCTCARLSMCACGFSHSCNTDNQTHTGLSYGIFDSQDPDKSPLIAI
jgi:hypothetical protein